MTSKHLLPPMAGFKHAIVKPLQRCTERVHLNRNADIVNPFGSYLSSVGYCSDTIYTGMQVSFTDNQAACLMSELRYTIDVF